jgi:hypothetical protein
MFGAFTLLMTRLVVEPANAQTQITDPETITKILKGFQISPVPINMQDKDPNLVGYGSYLVNAAGSCNDCHSAGAATEYAAPWNTLFWPAAHQGKSRGVPGRRQRFRRVSEFRW